MKDPFLSLYEIMGEATKVEASFFIAKVYVLLRKENIPTKKFACLNYFKIFLYNTY